MEKAIFPFMPFVNKEITGILVKVSSKLATDLTKNPKKKCWRTKSINSV